MNFGKLHRPVWSWRPWSAAWLFWVYLAPFAVIEENVQMGGNYCQGMYYEEGGDREYCLPLRLNMTDHQPTYRQTLCPACCSTGYSHGRRCLLVQFVIKLLRRHPLRPIVYFCNHQLVFVVCDCWDTCFSSHIGSTRICVWIPVKVTVRIK